MPLLASSIRPAPGVAKPATIKSDIGWHPAEFVAPDRSGRSKTECRRRRARHIPSPGRRAATRPSPGGIPPSRTDVDAPALRIIEPAVIAAAQPLLLDA